MSEKDILAITQWDEESSLHLMPSGPIPPNPAELIGSEQMRRLLKVLERNFTHVVIDSPPIASFTDGVLLGSMVSVFGGAVSLVLFVWLATRKKKA